MSRKILCAILVLFSITFLLSHHNIELTAADDVVGKNGTTKLYDKAREINPNDVSSLVDKGLILYNMSNYDEAVEWFDKALAIDPNYMDALVNKGRALYNLERYEEVVDWLDKALLIGPSNLGALNRINGTQNSLGSTK